MGEIQSPQLSQPAPSCQGEERMRGWVHRLSGQVALSVLMLALVGTIPDPVSRSRTDQRTASGDGYGLRGGYGRRGAGYWPRGLHARRLLDSGLSEQSSAQCPTGSYSCGGRERAYGARRLSATRHRDIEPDRAIYRSGDQDDLRGRPANLYPDEGGRRCV